jgi:hypothetical protein
LSRTAIKRTLVALAKPVHSQAKTIGWDEAPRKDLFVADGLCRKMNLSQGTKTG